MMPNIYELTLLAGIVAGLIVAGALAMALVI